MRVRRVLTSTSLQSPSRWATRVPDRCAVVEVQAHIDERTLRGVALQATAGLKRGVPVRATGHSITVPVGGSRSWSPSRCRRRCSGQWSAASGEPAPCCHPSCRAATCGPPSIYKHIPNRHATWAQPMRPSELPLEKDSRIKQPSRPASLALLLS
jgi:ATP synthase alpha/beta family, beta-barrel domain